MVDRFEIFFGVRMDRTIDELVVEPKEEHGQKWFVSGVIKTSLPFPSPKDLSTEPV